MTKEQIYISVDGRESGKLWVDVSENPNKAWNIAELLEHILENMTYEEQMALRDKLLVEPIELTQEQQDWLHIAVCSINKNMSYESLKYSDYLYGREDQVDSVWDFRMEIEQIGHDQARKKYGQYVKNLL